jgi:hypothetical protein
LVLQGSAFAAGGLWVPSDQRYKKSIETIASPLETILKLKPSAYEYDTDKFPKKNFVKGKSYGFIAQDLQKTIPELVIADTAGMLAVNYDGIIPFLAGAIQEQEAKIQSILNPAQSKSIVKSSEDHNLLEQLNRLETSNQKQDSVIAQYQVEITDLKQFIQQQSLLLQAQTKELQTLKNCVQQSLNCVIEETPIPNSSNGTETPELGVNVPNPFSTFTEIPYYLPQYVKEARIIIKSTLGVTYKSYDNLPLGHQSLKVSLENLSAGTYIYSLEINGKEFQSKRMILTNHK